MIIPAAVNTDIRFRNLSQSNTVSNKPVTDPDLQNRATEALKDQFIRQFRDLASEPDKFYDLLKTVYGSNIDRDVAVTLRTQALRGDLSWMPEVKVVSSQTLQQGGELQGLGAYSAKDNVIYLNEKILATPELAQKVFNEEVGHALDTMLNTADTRGDEGALFSRMLSGEKISTGERSQIRSENDSGVIHVDGREVEVEFFMNNNNNNNANNNRNSNANNNSSSFVPGRGSDLYNLNPGSSTYGPGRNSSNPGSSPDPGSDTSPPPNTSPGYRPGPGPNTGGPINTGPINTDPINTDPINTGSIDTTPVPNTDKVQPGDSAILARLEVVGIDEFGENIYKPTLSVYEYEVLGAGPMHTVIVYTDEKGEISTIDSLPKAGIGVNESGNLHLGFLDMAPAIPAPR